MLKRLGTQRFYNEHIKVTSCAIFLLFSGIAAAYAIIMSKSIIDVGEYGIDWFSKNSSLG